MRALEFDPTALDRLLDAFARRREPDAIAAIGGLLEAHLAGSDDSAREEVIAAMFGSIVSGSTDPPRQSAAARCLRAASGRAPLPEEALERLAGVAAGHPVASVRAQLLDILGGSLDPPAAQDLLLRAIEQDEDPGVRRAAAEAMDRALAGRRSAVDRAELSRRIIERIRAEPESGARTQLALLATHLSVP